MVTGTLGGRPWGNRRWLVLAPHPDDETLGAGALIAQAAAQDRFAALVYLTDGSGSHPCSDGCAGRLIAVRRREAALALFRLTGSRKHVPVHLDWQDARPAKLGSMEFHQSVCALAALCRQLRVDAIAVTALHEPHCDHAAAAQLAYAAGRSAKRQVIVAEFCVWSSRPTGRLIRVIRTEAMPPGKRRAALRSHRSQLTASYGQGFRLPAEKQRMPARDTLYVWRHR